MQVIDEQPQVEVGALVGEVQGVARDSIKRRICAVSATGTGTIVGMVTILRS